MRDLFATLLVVVAALVAFDPLVPWLLEDRALARADEERAETFANVVFRSFGEASRSVNATVSRLHRRFTALPDAKPDDEIRAFVIGNSAALFAVAPEVLAKRLSAAYPERRVRLVPLLIPDAGVVDENLLVRAALDKRADLIVLLPNLKGLILGREERMRFLRELFGAPEDGSPLERPGDALRRLLVRHWQAYRHRDELRELVFANLPFALPAARERARIESAFEEIAAAAARSDVDALLRVYRERGMHRFVPAGLPPGDVPRNAPVFRTMRRTAEAVQASGAIGVAIFLPVNPLFRDPEAVRAHPELLVDDATLRRLARTSLEVYRRAGFATAEKLDALPPEAFIDLVHANAQGMRRFTETAGDVLVRALRALERRAGRSLVEGEPAAP